MSSFAYFFRESMTGFARNLSTALGSIITIFLSLLIIGIFIVFGNIVQNIVTSVEDNVSITAFLRDEAEEAAVQEVMDYVRGLEGVNTVAFRSKEEALEKWSQSMNQNPEIIEQLDGMNPMPASIEVELSDPQLVSDVAANIAANATYISICENSEDPKDSVKYGESYTEKLFTVTNSIRYIGIAFIALLIFIAMVFINNTIRLAILARRKEIAIMRLVGASKGFIRGPFLMEGALHAVLGACLAVAVLEALRNLVLPTLAVELAFLQISLDFSLFLMIYAILAGAGLVIGLLGSAFAMRRYLKV